MTEPDKVIYSMHKVSKHYNRTVIIEDISLSYFYGAKIGVLGLNGSGKSTLLKIMAGVDGEYEGEISIQPGFSVGYLEQEPELEAGKTVRQIVEEGVQETAAGQQGAEAPHGDPGYTFVQPAATTAAPDFLGPFAWSAAQAAQQEVALLKEQLRDLAETKLAQARCHTWQVDYDPAMAYCFERLRN